MKRTCIFDDCDRYRVGQGLCDRHYRKMLRETADTPCVVIDCKRFGTSRGLCNTHYSRQWYHGSTDWTPTQGGYTAVHQMLSKLKGKARTRRCTDCGGKADEWSYCNNDPDYITDERGRRYTWNLSLYVPRCRSCHHRFDGTITNITNLRAIRC